MFFKFALKIFKRFGLFVLTCLLGVLSFNLFHLNEKLKMLQVISVFHQGQMNNDKKVIDNLLTDNFTETGVRRFVQTPEVIDKRDVMRWDYSKINFKVEAEYPTLLNMFSSSRDSLSFVKKTRFWDENGKPLPSLIFYVTYTFEKTEGGLKISKIVRNL